jgi:outer membrane protein assembly factor BamB
MAKPSHYTCLALSSACLFACAIARIGHAADANQPAPPATRPTGEPVAQLAAGTAPGTFHLVFHGNARLAGAGHCALDVSVLDARFSDLAAMKLDDAKAFDLEADLPPGSCYLVVSPADKKSADYWPSDRQQIYIDKHGRLYQMHDGWSKPGPFVLDRKMKGLSPDGREVAAAQPPVLKWPAVVGATHYRGDYFGDDGQKWFDVDETQFVIGGGIPAGAWCMWRISALDAGGKLLARGEANFIGHGTDKATVEKMLQATGVCAVDPPQGRPYLGFQPLPTQVPKDPKTPPDDNESGGAVHDEAGGFIPGILVAVVRQGSPAVDAELVPDDVIIAFDGEPVPSEFNLGDIRAFVRQISAMGVGRMVSLTVRRFPQELTLQATIGTFGGAATRPTPAVADAVRDAPPPVAKPAAGLQWREVDSGSPAVFPFKADAHAPVVPLTSKDGLAADSVTVFAELPKGGMAFGTREGLSIWDGAEIRTCTGPSFSAVSRNVMRGNSGLPSSTIQDLLCDSRGRLWVATDYGVCRIDAGKAGAWHVLANVDRGPFSHRGMDSTMDVQKVFEASDGTVVLGSRDAAITVIDPKTDTPRLIHRDQDMNHWVTGIAEDSRHRLWFSVMGVGVLRYDGTRIEQVNGPWIKGTAARGLAIDGKGTVWVSNGTDGLGGLRSDGTTEIVAPEALPDEFIERLTVDRKGRLLAISFKGLAVYAADEPRGDKTWQYPDGMDVQFLGSVLNASDDSWWIGDESGVSRRTQLKLTSINPRAQAVDRLKREIERTYPKIAMNSRTAVEAKGIVVGIADGRVLRFDGRKWEDLSAKLAHIDVYQLFADSKGTIWIATGGAGLIGLDPSGAMRRFNNEPDHAKSVIYCVAETPDGTLYAGTQHGVYRLRAGNWEHVESDLFQVGRVLADRHGRVWMTEITYGKVYVYDGNTFHEVKEQSAIGDEPLAPGTLRLDADGNVLIDLPSRPAAKLPKRTFKWNAAADGKIGPPVEVK